MMKPSLCLLALILLLTCGWQIPIIEGGPEIVVDNPEDIFREESIRIESAKLVDNKLEIVTIFRSWLFFPEDGQAACTALKRIYKAEKSRIILEREVKGRYFPETVDTKKIPAKIVWE
jgi:hypothetical protein